GDDPRIRTRTAGSQRRSGKNAPGARALLRRLSRARRAAAANGALRLLVPAVRARAGQPPRSPGMDAERRRSIAGRAAGWRLGPVLVWQWLSRRGNSMDATAA